MPYLNSVTIVPELALGQPDHGGGDLGRRDWENGGYARPTQER